jgi:hypothetical protein
MRDAGLGTFINSRVNGSSKYFNHNGGNKGFSCTSVGSINEGNGVVVMINSNNSGILEEIVNSVAIVYNWKDYYLPVEKKVVQLSEELLDGYTGKYKLGENPGIIERTSEGLWMCTTPPAWKLYFTSDSDFFMRESRTAYCFRRGADGKVKGILVRDILLPRMD